MEHHFSTYGSIFYLNYFTVLSPFRNSVDKMWALTPLVEVHGPQDYPTLTFDLLDYTGFVETLAGTPVGMLSVTIRNLKMRFI